MAYHRIGRRFRSETQNTSGSNKYLRAVSKINSSSYFIKQDFVTRSIYGISLIVLLGVIGFYFYPEPGLGTDQSIDSLVVFKSRHVLVAYAEGVSLKTYSISIGKNSVGDKLYEGDMKTPEGRFTINDKNPNSGYHKNLGISYPDEFHRQQAAKLGKAPGGDIKIHGLKNGRGYIGKLHRMKDWTNGCIALTDEEIDELYARVKLGTPIIIYK